MFMKSVIAALGGDEFLKERLSRELVCTKIQNREHVELPGWSGLNKALGTARLHPSRVRAYYNGERVSDDEYMTVRYSRTGNAFRILDLPRLEKLLRNGVGLMVDSVDDIDPLVNTAVREFESFTTDVSTANAFVSFGTDSGFGPHWDGHDVVVVQLEGTKQWEIYGPFESDPVMIGRDGLNRCPDTVVWSGTLTAGDVLHVPRGWWHNVTATGSASYHMTFGFSRRTLLDVVGYVVDRLAADAGMRESLAIYDPAEIAEQCDYIKSRVATELDALHIKEFVSRHQSDQPLRQVSSLPFAVDASTAPDDCIIQRLTRNAFSISFEGDSLTVNAGSKILTFNSHYRRLLEHISARENTTVETAYKESGFTRKTFDSAMAELCTAGLIGLSFVS